MKDINIEAERMSFDPHHLGEEGSKPYTTTRSLIKLLIVNGGTDRSHELKG